RRTPAADQVHRARHNWKGLAGLDHKNTSVHEHPLNSGGRGKHDTPLPPSLPISVRIGSWVSLNLSASASLRCPWQAECPKQSDERPAADDQSKPVSQDK